MNMQAISATISVVGMVLGVAGAVIGLPPAGALACLEQAGKLHQANPDAVERAKNATRRGMVLLVMGIVLLILSRVLKP